MDSNNIPGNEESTFALCRSIGENSYEVECFIVKGVMRIKVVREFVEDGALRRKLQTIVFPLEILDAIHEIVHSSEIELRERNTDASRIQSVIDQLGVFLDERREIVDALGRDEVTSKATIARSIVSGDFDEMKVDEEFAAIVRALAVVNIAARCV